MARNGGQLAARTLAEAGVEVVFALHGGHLDSFLSGCIDEGIRLVDCRHEAAAVNAADGYARITGRLGVAAVTSGPGLTNGLAGITNAAADGIPLLVITSSSPIREIETLELQGGLDLIAMVSPVTRWARKALSAARVPDLVGMAIRRAQTIPTGPTVIDIPIDVAFTPVEEKDELVSGPPEVPPRAVAPQPTIEAAADLIKSAQRPILIVGEGSLTNDLTEPLKTFADHTGVPVFTSTLGKSGLPAGHPQNAGNVQFAGFIGEPADVVILAGARQGMFTGGRGGSMIPEGAKVIQICDDPAEIGRLYPVAVGIGGAPGPALEAIARARNYEARQEWCAKARGVKGAADFLFPDPGMEDDGIHPHRIAKDLMATLEPGCILVLDGGEAAIWAGWAVGETDIFATLNLGYQGHLGVGQGYAIGAQLACPDRRVLQVAGDGAIGFHIQEWETMVRHNLPIVTVVFNNACWGMSIHGQEAVNGPGKDVISKLLPTAYEKVAEGFGAHGERVTTAEEMAPAVERAFASGKPAVINVMTSARIVHPVTTALLGDLTVTDEIIVPYYQNLPK